VSGEKTQVAEVGNVMDLALVNKQEIDSQIATAHTYPRKPAKAVETAIEFATYSPQTAKSCIYFRPVGKKDGIQQFVMGPSIRLAEVLKSQWGNLRVAVRTIGERDGMIGVQAACHDLESNVAETTEEWKNITYSNGNRYNDNMVKNAIGAASKIAVRNVLFSVIPKVYAEQIMDACKAKIVGDDIQAMYAAVLQSFQGMGISEDELLNKLETTKENLDNDAIVTALGLNNAIKDGLVKLDDVFGQQHGERQPINPQQRQEAKQQVSEKQRYAVLSEQLNKKDPAALNGVLGMALEVAEKALEEFTEADYKNINAEIQKELNKNG
jgi:hypothetical protein